MTDDCHNFKIRHHKIIIVLHYQGMQLDDGVDCSDTDHVKGRGP
jgi:hypothetical protein